MDNENEAYNFDEDPEWVAFYFREMEKERNQSEPSYTPGDKWSDPRCADPDALLINWL